MHINRRLKIITTCIEKVLFKKLYCCNIKLKCCVIKAQNLNQEKYLCLEIFDKILIYLFIKETA